MLPSGRADVAEALAALQAEFASTLPSIVDGVHRLWEDWLASLTPELGRDLLRRAHSLSGSGGTYGLPEISRAARALELCLQPLIVRNTAPDEEEIQRVERLVGHLAATARAAVPQPLAAVSSEQLERGRRVLVLGDDSLWDEIAGDGSNSLFVAERVMDGEQLDAALESPALAVVLSEDRWLTQAPSPSIRAHGAALICAARAPDLQARLRSVRLGSAALVTQPLAPVAMPELVDRLLAARRPQPFRVLIVDDDRSATTLYAAALRGEGMIVEVVNDPLQIMTPLIEFRPELILLDMHMPGCSGAELAAVVRQQNDLLSVPIVFLSADTSWERQREAMSAGGDDFLVKPIPLDRLVAAVRDRAQRLRDLGARIARDGLTGLYNQGSIRERLEGELVRAQRSGTALSFALIDVDRFKSVNDTHGHPVGDRVLRALGELLKSGLRRTDLVGRFGGEEFALVLPGTTSADAERLVDRLRSEFSALVHLSGNQSFQVTFSAGIASTGSAEIDPHALIDSADKALYRAKAAGRNRVLRA